MKEFKQNKLTNNTLPSIASLNAYAKKNIEKLITLHQKIELSKKKENIAIALMEQKRIIDALVKDASKGNAIVGLTTLRAMVITGMKFDRFFDYTTPYVDNRGFEKIQEFTKLETLIPLMQKYRTVEKADDVISFVMHLPNLNNIPFQPILFDVLNEKQTKKSNFQETLFHRLENEYYKASEILKKPIKNALKMAMYKGYSSAALAYISIFEKENHIAPKTVSKILQSVCTNKYSSDSDRKIATLKLKQIKVAQMPKTKLKKDQSLSL